MLDSLLLYAIIALPAVAFLFNGLVLRLLPSKLGGGTSSRVAGIVNVVAILASSVLAIMALLSVLSDGNTTHTIFSWVSIPGLELTALILLDPLTAIMLVTVSLISLLVHIYALVYMRGERSYTRFFTFMALFTASMLGLVSSGNIVQMFIFWELVGVCSYFLISFWVTKPSAIKAAKKAFIMTRIGDFGFILAMMGISYLNPAWLELTVFYDALNAGELATGAAALLSLGFLLAAVGKSAQMPLHSWLPDAMEGPTPVSALLHSATMVTAGFFLIARLFPLFQYTDVHIVVAVVGLATAVMAATVGMVATDIKRVLAFSTVSQIGYMVFAIGIGAYGAAIFHLFIHAFFKAGLFMVAGNVGHATGTYDMRLMGGLRKVMPITYWIAIICGLSLAAIFPLSGFWSKDEIITAAFDSPEWIIGGLILLGVSVLTAFYTFRMIFMTFHGKRRTAAEVGLEEAEDDHGAHGPAHEASWWMLAPMILLSAGAIVLGFLINPVGFSLGAIEEASFAHFITDNVAVFGDHGVEEHHFNFVVAGLSILAGLAGLGLAVLIYARGRGRMRIWKFPPFNGINAVVFNQYYINKLYEDLISQRFFYGTVGRVTEYVETELIDKFGDRLAGLTQTFARVTRVVQNGHVQVYAFAMIMGVVLIALLYYLVVNFRA